MFSRQAAGVLLMWAGKKWTNRSMPQPRASVVRKEARARAGISARLMRARRSAPRVPRMKPKMFTSTIMMAVNSTVSRLRMQSSTIMTMVSRVRARESGMPLSRHSNATAACSTAMPWTIQLDRILFMPYIIWLKFTQNLPNAQEGPPVRPVNPSFRPQLSPDGRNAGRFFYEKKLSLLD